MARQYIPMTKSARDSLIAICILWVLVGTVVFLRLLGRYRGVGIGADDILSVIAFALATSTIGLNAAVFVSGVGYNLDSDIPEYPKLLGNIEYIMQITFTFTLLYLWALAALKLSQLCFYWRAFSVRLKNWILAVGVIVIAWGLSFTFVFIFLCKPIKQQWTLERIGHCVDQILVLKCIIMTNVVTDLFIVILPVRTVWHLQMRRTEKIAVLTCFALGLGCCIIGIVRFWQIFVIDLIGNLTGTSLTTFMLCTVELMLAGLCINIPMLRPFYLRIREKYQSSRTDSTNGKTSGYKGSQSGRRAFNPNKPGHYTAWIELDETHVEKDHESNSNDDSSQVQLTRESLTHGIHVSKDFAITQS
ncbi:hypothetical protein VTO42DRAFT_1364 [Malbranchea cinnamomea]